MKTTEIQNVVVYSLLKEIKVANEAGDRDCVDKLSTAAIHVITNVAI